MSVAFTREDIADVQEMGESMASSFEVRGQRLDRQPWEYHQGKRLLALARRMRAAFTGGRRGK